MKVCDENKCSGCYACYNVCPKKCILVEDNGDTTKANIDENKCIHCNLCKKVCPAYNECTFIYPKNCYEGWIKDDEKRKYSSSGGIASAIMTKFIQNGGFVAACAFIDGEFKFKLTNDIKDIKWFRGSKYVKSKPYDIYNEIKNCLIHNKVLFIGLPCQVSGLFLYLNKKNIDNLFTIDLICHGTPTQALFQSFYYENSDKNIKSHNKISFRKKHNFQVYCDDKPIEYEGVQDAYTIAFLEGLTYSENCYSCKYARIERISDITLGDSWSYLGNDAAKGVSLVLVQTDKGEKLLNDEDIYLHKCDINSAINSNHQLNHPSIMPKQRKYFFENYKSIGFVKTVKKSLPKKYFKQKLKKLMIKIGLYRK